MVLSAVVVLLAIIAVDLLYKRLDPRIALR